MNIQAKIDQLKTFHELKITYAESYGDSVLAIIRFEVYLGEGMKDVAKEEFKGVPVIQRGSGHSGCLSMITEDYLPSFLQAVKLVDVETGEVKRTLYDKTFLSMCIHKTKQVFEGLLDGAFDVYVDLKNNVSKTYVDLYVAIKIVSSDGVGSSTFFNAETNAFDSLYDYNVSCCTGLGFKEKRLDESESEIILSHSEIEDILANHSLLTKKD